MALDFGQFLPPKGLIHHLNYHRNMTVLRIYRKLQRALAKTLCLKLLSQATYCLALSLLLCHCSSYKVKDYSNAIPSGEKNSEPFAVSPNEQQSPTVQTSAALLAPWKTWEKGRSIKKVEFTDSRLSYGDKLFEESDFISANEAYKSVKARGSDELESLALRIASIELLTGETDRSIVSLSKFFQNNKQKESQVSSSSALFFGYAYGQSRNFEQAFAWFSQALRSESRLISERAAQGVKLLLRVIPNPKLEELSYLWKIDEVINSLIAQERSLRQVRPVVVLEASKLFWRDSETENLQAGNVGNAVTPKEAGKVRAAVLLPLSGRFAKMGEAIRKGLELAAEHNPAAGLNLNFLDYSDGATQVVGELANQSTSVIVGPLISDKTDEVANEAREHSIPTVLLAKGGTATLGEGVYRFGLTNQSQAKSLIAAIIRYRPNPRIALVYPSDEASYQFISSVEAELKRHGIKTLSDHPYQKGNKNEMLAAAEQMSANPPEFVIFADNLKAGVEFFSALNPNVRQRVIPVGSALWDNSIEVMQSKTILNGAIYVSAFYPDMSKPHIAEFIQRYKEKNGKNPDFFSAQGYDVGLLLAASNSSRFKPPPRFEGVTGPAHLERDGEIVRELAVMRLAHGVIAPIDDIPAPKPNFQILQDDSAEGIEAIQPGRLPDESGDPTLGQ